MFKAKNGANLKSPQAIFENVGLAYIYLFVNIHMNICMFNMREDTNVKHMKNIYILLLITVLSHDNSLVWSECLEKTANIASYQ